MVWKRDEEQPAKTPPTATSATGMKTPRPSTSSTAHGYATIGPSIVIKGEVTGDEDVLIEGRVDGSVALDLHSVTVGNGGKVKADITGRVITVEGDVEGNLSAKEQIVLRGSARVTGDIHAPRVVLEDGATFRGLVDMGVDTPTAEKGTTKPKGATTSTAAGGDQNAANGKTTNGKTTGTVDSKTRTPAGATQAKDESGAGAEASAS